MSSTDQKNRQENCPACSANDVARICRRKFRGREWWLARCSVCRQHYTSPLPTDDDIASFYSGNYHAELRSAGGTEAAFERKYHRYADTLVRHLARGKVLDVGCSTGLLVKILRDRGYDAEGTELNRASAEYGRSHFGVTIYNQPLNNCPIEPGSLSALLMTDVLEHARHPRDFLRDAGQFLASDGFALITFPDICSIESRYQRAMSLLLRREWIWSCCHIPLHTWEFTPATARACFEGAGFRVVEFRRTQPPTEPIEMLALKLLMLPRRVLNWPGIGRMFGTQMEFVIQKT